MLKPRKCHTDNHQELKTTPHTEYFRPNRLTFIQVFLLQRSCNEMKVPSWSIL